MNGIRYIFDTNALISFLHGNPILKSYASATIGISIVSVLEFLSYPHLDETDKKLLFGFMKEIEVYELRKDDRTLINLISELRIESKIKLPDAIIAATAIRNNATLITTDRGFLKIPSLQTVTF